MSTGSASLAYGHVGCNFFAIVFILIILSNILSPVHDDKYDSSLFLLMFLFSTHFLHLQLDCTFYFPACYSR